MLSIDEARGCVIVQHPDGTRAEHAMDTADAFELVSAAWLRCGWDVKYAYGFSWMGRPVIQLPEDMIRIQEVIWRLRPDIIINTGVAHGGSLVFYASLLEAMGRGRVVGVDVGIPPLIRTAIEAHAMAPHIMLVEGCSTLPATFATARDTIEAYDTVLVILDSNHTRDHVAMELTMYSTLVTPGSYIVVCDGIMAQVAGAPRTEADWSWNNPLTAVNQFLTHNPDFALEEPAIPFNEGKVRNRVTYWPKSFLRRQTCRL